MLVAMWRLMAPSLYPGFQLYAWMHLFAVNLPVNIAACGNLFLEYVLLSQITL